MDASRWLPIGGACASGGRGLTAVPAGRSVERLILGQRAPPTGGAARRSSTREQAAEAEPRRRPQPRRLRGHQGHQVGLGAAGGPRGPRLTPVFPHFHPVSLHLPPTYPYFHQFSLCFPSVCSPGFCLFSPIFPLFSSQIPPNSPIFPFKFPRSSPLFPTVPPQSSPFPFSLYFSPLPLNFFPFPPHSPYFLLNLLLFFHFSLNESPFPPHFSPIPPFSLSFPPFPLPSPPQFSSISPNSPLCPPLSPQFPSIPISPPINCFAPPRRALRKALTHLELRRAARRPTLPLKVKPGLPLRPGGSLPPPAPPHPASTSEPIVLED